MLFQMIKQISNINHLTQIVQQSYWWRAPQIGCWVLSVLSQMIIQEAVQSFPLTQMSTEMQTNQHILWAKPVNMILRMAVAAILNLETWLHNSLIHQNNIEYSSYLRKDPTCTQKLAISIHYQWNLGKTINFLKISMISPYLQWLLATLCSKPKTE